MYHAIWPDHVCTFTLHYSLKAWLMTQHSWAPSVHTPHMFCQSGSFFSKKLLTHYRLRFCRICCLQRHWRCRRGNFFFFLTDRYTFLMKLLSCIIATQFSSDNFHKAISSHTRNVFTFFVSLSYCNHKWPPMCHNSDIVYIISSRCVFKHCLQFMHKFWCLNLELILSNHQWPTIAS